MSADEGEHQSAAAGFARQSGEMLRQCEQADGAVLLTGIRAVGMGGDQHQLGVVLAGQNGVERVRRRAGRNVRFEFQAKTVAVAGKRTQPVAGRGANP